MKQIKYLAKARSVPAFNIFCGGGNICGAASDIVGISLRISKDIPRIFAASDIIVPTLESLSKPVKYKPETTCCSNVAAFLDGVALREALP